MAKGKSQKNLEMSTKSEIQIQYRPKTNWPNPNHQPIQNDFLLLFWQELLIKNQPLKAIIANGKKYRGANANAEIEPKKKEIKYWFLNKGLIFLDIFFNEGYLMIYLANKLANKQLLY